MYLLKLRAYDVESNMFPHACVRMRSHTHAQTRVFLPHTSPCNVVHSHRRSACMQKQTMRPCMHVPPFTCANASYARHKRVDVFRLYVHIYNDVIYRTGTNTNISDAGASGSNLLHMDRNHVVTIHARSNTCYTNAYWYY